ncbi:ribonuclease HII [Desulfurispora thermophila]|uniref:ribonuclease HII n=1 Tax=Desulfurispora thermophila TaxID=265470 RepID=UPI00036530A0|nr:ribonuclease HII [Desulfurispora thermophila]
MSKASEITETSKPSDPPATSENAARNCPAPPEAPESTARPLTGEQFLWQCGLEYIAGVDEAGRGPLAGPVVAAAVILPPGYRLPGLKDSKQLTSRQRQALAAAIQQQALAWNVALATVGEIDQLNILQASLLAMRRAVQGLKIAPQHVLVDGRFTVPGLDLPQTAIVRGDALSACIAAASVLAKVYRDDLMQALHQLYPQYGFDRHKGYPTAAHRAALNRHGPSPVHRRTFRGVCQ